MSLIRKIFLADPANISRLIKFDPIVRAILNITSAHQEIHEGSAFMVDAVNILMSDGDTLILAFKTPSGIKRVHFVMDYSSLVSSHIELIEAPIWTTGTGSLITILNRKRETSMKSSGVLEDLTSTPTFAANNAVLLDPTGLSGGTTIKTMYAFGAKQRSTTLSRDVSENLLWPDVQYAVRLTSDDNSNKGQLHLDWYEHTDD